MTVAAEDVGARELPGLDVAALEEWLRRERPDVLGDRQHGVQLDARLIAGGRSNLTYAIEGASQPLVLRRPPLGHVQRTAHDMAREFRVISALGGTDVPVPRAILLVEDADADAGTGSPFYLMERVDGRILRSRADNAHYPGESLGALSRELVQTLAALHSIDPDSVGLGDFGRVDGFLDRQLDRWARQYDGSRTRELPELDALQDELRTGVPPTGQGGIVHGDYRLDNALVRDVDGRPRIAAILDWEMSTLGDPLTDLGLFGLYWGIGSLPGVPAGIVPSSVSEEDGYLSFDELVADYADATGRPIPQLPWYLAFAAYKLAVILEGIHYRYRAGQTVGEGFESIGALVDPLARLGRDYLKGA